MATDNTCGVCLAAPHKYKCPKCYLKYCSVSCYKKHVETPCQKLSEVSAASPSKSTESPLPFTIDAVAKKPELLPNDDFVTASTVSPDHLRLLRNDEGIASCLRNPHLRDLMLSLNSAEDPGKAMQEAMMEPLFVQLADHCLRIVDDKNGVEVPRLL